MESENRNLLILGTVQLGMKYGVANVVGQPDLEMATEIVREAWKGGIREFDTAQDYGTSEETLGIVFERLGISDDVSVITKFSHTLNLLNRSCVERSIDESLERLGINTFQAVLLHKEEYLDLLDQGLFKILYSLLEQGKVMHIGVSIYSPQKSLQALKSGLQIIQFPSNILDRRFEIIQISQRAEELNKLLYIRSVFLQGLLLMSSKNLPSYMSFVRPVLERFEKFSHAVNISQVALALSYIKATFPYSKVLVGAEKVDQIQEVMKAWNVFLPLDILHRVRLEFTGVDETIINPSLWPNSL